MLQTKKNCSVCKKIKESKTLLKDLYESTYYDKRGKMSLLQISEQHGLSYQAVTNHAKKHQALSAEALTDRRMKDIATKAEKQIILKKLDSNEVWDEVLQQGMDKLKEGEMHIKATDLLKAAKDKSDYQFKAKDQELQLAEMVMFFASGANNPELRKTHDINRLRGNNEHRTVIEGETISNTNATTGTSADNREGTDGSDSIHYPPSWDAPSFRTSEVPSGDDF